MSESAESASSQGNVFRVQGGHPISGVLRPSGNKNEALPVLAAALLASEGAVTLENLPDIADIRDMICLTESVGVQLERDDGVLRMDATHLGNAAPDSARAAEIRGSFLLSAPLLARTGEARLPRPGGDKIGRRRIDTHLLALEALGAKVDFSGTDYIMTLDGRFVGADVFLDEASVMATENALMAAAMAEGTTRIANAASEPHVQGLCRMLVGMGAQIRGIGTNLLEIRGSSSLTGCHHVVGPDHIEIGSFMGLAAVTGGELEIGPVNPDDLRMICMVFGRLGVESRLEGDRLFIPGQQKLKMMTDAHEAIPKLDDAPWPGFPADLVSIAMVVATQSTGTILVHEKLFESRMFWVDRLVAMGARIVLCDPHRAVVVGPARLHGATISSPDIRAGMSLLIAALCAEGESVIQNVHQIDRGYERIDERLRQLGAQVERV